jgi:hypothetical protein
MRGENCVDARVRVISRIAKTIDTTVMIDVAMSVRMAWATCGSARDGNRIPGTREPIAGTSSSSHEKTAPAAPSARAMMKGRMRKPPRNA